VVLVSQDFVFGETVTVLVSQDFVFGETAVVLAFSGFYFWRNRGGIGFLRILFLEKPRRYWLS